MGTFLDQARQTQKDKQSKDKDKDPADLSGSTDPWATDGAGGSGGAASGNAGDLDDGNERQAEPEAPTRKAAPTRTPALRRGRPQGPARKAVTARILMKNNRMLTKAVEKTGKLPQTIFDEALEAYFKRLKIEDPGEEPAAGEDVDAA